MNKPYVEIYFCCNSEEDVQPCLKEEMAFGCHFVNRYMNYVCNIEYDSQVIAYLSGLVYPAVVTHMYIGLNMNQCLAVVIKNVEMKYHPFP
jgi:hypothetical protein